MKQLTQRTRDHWRTWLGRNHDKSDGVWLVFYKKHTGKRTLDYDTAVEEALCVGWIDSIIKLKETPHAIDSTGDVLRSCLF